MRRIRTVNAARRRKDARERRPSRRLRPETLKRIARGVARFVPDGPGPFAATAPRGR